MSRPLDILVLNLAQYQRTGEAKYLEQAQYVLYTGDRKHELVLPDRQIRIGVGTKWDQLVPVLMQEVRWDGEPTHLLVLEPKQAGKQYRGRIYGVKTSTVRPMRTIWDVAGLPSYLARDRNDTQYVELNTDTGTRYCYGLRATDVPTIDNAFSDQEADALRTLFPALMEKAAGLASLELVRNDIVTPVVADELRIIHKHVGECMKHNLFDEQ